MSNRTIFLFICREKRRPYRVPLTIMSLEKRMNDNRDPLCIANKRIQEGSSLQGDIEKKHRWLVERKGYRKTGQCPAGL